MSSDGAAFVHGLRWSVLHLCLCMYDLRRVVMLSWTEDLPVMHS